MAEYMAPQPSSVNRSDAAWARRIELERHLFGWMLRGDFNAIQFAEIAREIAEVFNPPHDRIMAAIFAASVMGEATSAAAIALRLANDKSLTELGGIDYLRDWSFGAPALTSENDCRKRVERAVADYSAIINNMALEDKTSDALEALRAGMPDAIDQLSELARGAEVFSAGRNIVAAPFQYRAAEDIPTRKWLYGRHAIRGFISATAASGGTGKTALALAETLALVTGRPLLGDTVQRHAAWYLGLEDPLEEYERRIAASMLLHNLNEGDLAGGLFINSGRGGEFVIAGESRGGLFINRPVVSAIIRNIRQNNIALVTVDPFVACHTVAESDNTAIAAVAREWAHIADETGCAIELVHHVRKGMGSTQEASADDSRGASAFINATRSARLLMTMSREEADQGGITPDDRRRYFKVTNAKANLTLHGDAAVWRVLESITLKNGGGGPDDLVGAVSAWNMPPATEFADARQRAAVIEKLRDGTWRQDKRAGTWAGIAVAAVMGIDAGDKGTKHRIDAALAAWTKAGLLKVETRQDSKRMQRSFLVPA